MDLFPKIFSALFIKFIIGLCLLRLRNYSPYRSKKGGIGRTNIKKKEETAVLGIIMTFIRKQALIILLNYITCILQIGNSI